MHVVCVRVCVLLGCMHYIPWWDTSKSIFRLLCVQSGCRANARLDAHSHAGTETHCRLPPRLAKQLFFFCASAAVQCMCSV